MQIASMINSNNAASGDMGISTIDFVNARQSLSLKIKSCDIAHDIANKFLLDNQENQDFKTS